MMILVTFGVGYGLHRAEIDVDDDASDEEIEEWVSQEINERLSWGWKKAEK